MKEFKDKYHLVFCDAEGDIFDRWTFYYLVDSQFFILDEVGVICDRILKDKIAVYPDHHASWSRDISVHELAYYDWCKNSICNKGWLDKDGTEWCHDCDTIYTVYFFNDDYIDNWYFKEHYSYLFD